MLRTDEIYHFIKHCRVFRERIEENVLSEFQVYFLIKMCSLREKEEFESAFFKEKSVTLPILLICILGNKCDTD
jgi:hypothetical protein